MADVTTRETLDELAALRGRLAALEARLAAAERRPRLRHRAAGTRRGRLLTSLLLVLLLVALPLGLQANQASGPQVFTDVPPTNIFYDHIQAMYYNGITKGCASNGTRQFCPSAPLTRGEMAAFIIRAGSGAAMGEGATTPALTNAFTPVATVNVPIGGEANEDAQRRVKVESQARLSGASAQCPCDFYMRLRDMTTGETSAETAVHIPSAAFAMYTLSNIFLFTALAGTNGTYVLEALLVNALLQPVTGFTLAALVLIATIHMYNDVPLE